MPPSARRYLEEVKKLSSSDLAGGVWPYYTYGSLAAVFPLGILAEAWGYRPTIFLGLCCREATRMFLIFGNGVGQMAVMQVIPNAYCL